MTKTALKPWNTAMRRKGPSAPLGAILKWIKPPMRVLDFGCGRGADVAHLRKLGVEAEGYDSHAEFGCPMPDGLFDAVVSIYVLNVIPTPKERKNAVRLALSKVRPGGKLILVSRTPKEISREAAAKGWQPHGDGFLSDEKRGTFQKGLGTKELAGLMGRVGQHAFTIAGGEFSMVVSRTPSEIAAEVPDRPR